MKRIITIIVALLIPSMAFGQAGGYLRNDGAFTGNSDAAKSGSGNRLPSAASVDWWGRVAVVALDSSGVAQSNIPISNNAGLTGIGATNVAGLYIGTATATGGTTTVLTFASHSFRVNDYAKAISGTAGNINAWAPVTATTATTVTLAYPLPTTPANADVFQILRPAPVAATSLTNNLIALAVSIDSSTQFSAATGILKQEDVGAANNDAGIASLYVAESAITGSVSATGDYITPKADLGGRSIFSYAPPGESWQTCSAAATGTADTPIKTALASNRFYVTSISCSNTAAVASAITFKDATTAIYTGAVGTQASNGGGFTAFFPVPLRGSVNTPFNFAMTTTATSTTCCAAGYISTI